MSTQDVGHPWAAQVLRLTHRVRQWDLRHRWVLDAGGVLLIFLMFGAPDIGDHQDGDGPPIAWTDRSLPEMLLLQATLLLPLYWRRRAPFVAFHAVIAVFIVQWAAGIMFRADVAVLVALYNLVLHGSLRRLPRAAPALIAAYVVVVVRLSGTIGVWDAMFGLAVFGTAAIALGLAVRLRRAQLAALRDRAVQLEIERDQRSRLAAATERTRVAREMHDIVGHSLSVIVTLADGGAYAADTAPARSKEALQLIGDTGRRSLAELRRMLGVLREQTDEPDLSPQPGLADLDPLCQRVRAAGPQVEYHSSGDLDALDAGVQLAAYRIVQEALTNTLKHAGPRTRVHLALRIDGTRLRIAVRDNGLPARPGAPGHGLIGMRERAAMYDGTVTAGPAPGGGWSVEADLSLSESDPA
ncbi:sensor histidine kinase [Dactylosporangium sp. NBC_01737]|uniref:sensor histidine kinase n=1 Tax=Dactylosporangium sp. NBC_01737 TaxID=2975959 RepID=UPI002E123243|nr:sensor histidine kinase [Dactylosporangium sp. NBC_01737]